MGLVLSLNAKCYRNSGTYEAPSWVEMTNIKDLTLNVEDDEFDVTTRAGQGWEQVVQTIMRGTLEFGSVWDTADADFAALQAAHFGRTAIEVLVLDGPHDTVGSQGLRASMVVLNFSRSENLAEALMVNVRLKPTRAANPPAWYTAS